MQIPEEIVSFAKEAIIRFGNVEPMLFVQGTKGKVAILMSLGKDSDERVTDMSLAGANLAKRAAIGDVELVVLMSEGWVSPARAKMVMPSQDPDRMEVLMLSGLDARTNTQTLEMFACRRDKKQAIVDLKPVTMPGEIESRLLPAFMAGFRLFRK